MDPTVRAFLLLDATQASDVLAENTPSSFLDPILIDNPIANNLGLGTMVGKSVLPARVINDPVHAGRVEYLSALPIHLLDLDVLRLPFVP